MAARSEYELPLSFRKEAVMPLMQCLAAGDSCLVVGIGSVGKSNLLRFMQREDVCQEYLDADKSAYLFVFVDTNKMLERSLWGLLELMLHQLMTALTGKAADEKVLQALDELHQRITDSQTRYLALRFLDRALAIVCDQLSLRLVFLIDEFDELCRTLSASDLAALRALRDDHKYQLMYAVATRFELNRLRKEIAEIEAFEELVSPSTFWLGPYSETDARFMLHRLEGRYGICLDQETTDSILSATGGHPGLLRAAYRVAIEHPDSLLDALKLSPQVQDECKRIWTSLKPEEQKVIARVAASNVSESEQADVFSQLRRKGMVNGPWTKDDAVFSPLFAEYIRRKPVVGMHIQVDHGRRIILVDGCPIEDLSLLEFELIAYLDAKRGKACSRDELIYHLYSEDEILDKKGGVTDDRLRSIVKRLRERIEPVPRKPRYILTVRGYGYKLVDGEEDAGREAP